MKRNPWARWLAASIASFILLSVAAIVLRPANVEASTASTTTKQPTTTDQVSATTAAATTTVLITIDPRMNVADTDPWREVCDDVEGDFPQYFAQTDGLPSGYFGPAARISGPQEALDELLRRMCLDPMLAASVAMTFNGVFDDTDEVNATIDQFVADREVWLKAVFWVRSLADGTKVLPDGTNVVKVEVIDVNVDEALTQSVRLRPGLAPHVVLDNERKLRYFALRFAFSDNAVVDLQLNCGFQPTVLDKGTVLATPAPPVTVTTLPPPPTTSTTVTTAPTTSTTTSTTGPTTTVTTPTTATTRPTTTTTTAPTTTTTTTSTTTTQPTTTTVTKPPEPPCDPSTRPPWDPCP